MIILLWLLFLVQAAHAGKITEEENSKLKERCSKSAVAPNVYKRYRADRSKYPFAVALSYDDNGSHSAPFCSGVLISYRHILTAAHCLVINKTEACNKSLTTGQLQLQGLPAQRLGVFLPSNCSTSKCWVGKDIHRVASVHRDRNYDNVNEACKNTSSYDIGVIELEGDVRGPPICMPQANDAIPQKAKSIGYGPYNRSVEVDGRSMQVEDYSMQAVDYDSVQEDPDPKEKAALVAYTKHKNEATISGDSGGPLLQKLIGKYYLVGTTTTSTNPDPANPAEVMESWFVDVRKKLDWICDETGVCPLTDSGESKRPPSEEEESS
ncbi:unnamed protein product [Cylicocyclus nassatus]|uniref:Peptidase S1 domain-containing protein n=1 Tax=Cylicocyclus nassatus TaxID=53992 RepID=A0AA36LZV1_CYLNA|nr:unnamed protein product [Cylicocyclus nassatus]